MCPSKPECQENVKLVFLYFSEIRVKRIRVNQGLGVVIIWGIIVNLTWKFDLIISCPSVFVKFCHIMENQQIACITLTFQNTAVY